jgi:L-asparaginase II
MPCSNATLQNFIPLVEVTRGPLVESLHFGAAAVVDVHNRLIASLGDPHTVSFLRSSSKPFQALPLIETGGAEAFQLSDREIALICASHTGTDAHINALKGLQAKIGITAADLLCGVQKPTDEASAAALICRGEQPTNLHQNCSGKHSGMLAYTRLHHLPKADYINPDHPLQKIILQAVAEMMDMPVEAILLGTDGCSAPVFAVPLTNAALAYARLCDPSGLPEARAAALRHIARAMPAHPEMVAGPGKFDTALMAAFKGKIITKVGAEGYQAVGLMPGLLGPDSPALGITLTICDGDLKERARPVVILEMLRQLGVPFSSAQSAALAEFDIRPVQNWRKLDVGEIRPCFELKIENTLKQ